MIGQGKRSAGTKFSKSLHNIYLRLSRWICANIKRVGRDLSGIWLRLLRGISENIKRIKEDLQSSPRRSSPDMGIYGKQLGSVDLLGGVLSHKTTHQNGLSAVGIVVP